VDDDLTVGVIAARLLEQAGLGVCLALSGALALAALASGGYDFALVLSDIQMPGTNGIDLAHAIQRGWPDLPVVLMSGSESPAALAAHGLTDVPLLRKPFDHVALLAVVAGAIGPVQLTGS
jgi:two-component system response regulator AtoC